MSLAASPAFFSASIRPSRASTPRPAPPPESVVIRPTFTGSADTADTPRASAARLAAINLFIPQLPLNWTLMGRFTMNRFLVQYQTVGVFLFLGRLPSAKDDQKFTVPCAPSTVRGTARPPASAADRTPQPFHRCPASGR